MTTAPSVVYKVVKTNGEVEMIDNPTNLPPVQEIDWMEEPFVDAQVITPQDYVGAIMELCQDKRGVFRDMKYIEGGRVLLNYDLPLNEVIYDFFDQLKSRTRGYASFDYELKGYQKSDLVKLDMLLNGEQCDALSIIVHRDRAYARGRSIAEKLKDAIPRQLFEIPIQAAIGGKVIARETVKALRKDVLAKCYGGDITRKKKLLGKAEGGQEAHAPGGQRVRAQRGVHGRFEDGLTGGSGMEARFTAKQVWDVRAARALLHAVQKTLGCGRSALAMRRASARCCWRSVCALDMKCAGLDAALPCWRCSARMRLFASGADGRRARLIQAERRTRWDGAGARPLAKKHVEARSELLARRDCALWQFSPLCALCRGRYLLFYTNAAGARLCPGKRRRRGCAGVLKALSRRRRGFRWSNAR